MQLAGYERLKFELGALLRDYQPAADRRAEHASLLSALAEDRFNLVTIGRYNRGKSSLMNALLTTDRLPMGIVPLTSVITAVQYGSTERATLYYHGTSLFMDVAIDELARHITETGNPGNSEDIECAEIDLPATLLRSGFRFIDTPGLGSSIAANTRTTQRFLRQADAFLIVTSFDAPLTEEELAVMQRATAANARVFLAVNKSDLLDAGDRAVVLEHVRSTMASRFGDTVPIFPVSARLAMEAQHADDKAMRDASGIDALQQALVAFLVADKSLIFLTNMVARIGNHLSYTNKAEAMQRLEGIARRVATIGVVRPEPTEPASESEPITACAICVAVERAVFDEITHLQARLGHDQQIRSALTDRGGLCPPHAWQFEAIAGPLAIAAGLAGLIESHADRLDDLGRDPTHRICPICTAAASAQAHAIEQIIEYGKSSRAWSSLICLPHFPALLGRFPSAQRGKWVDHQTTLMRRLVSDMRRFMLKREGQQRYAINVEETSAGHAAIGLLAGNPHAYPPQPPQLRSTTAGNEEFS